MSNRQQLKKAVEGMPNTSPLLIMGGAVKDFRMAYKGPIKSVRTLDDVREIVAYYSSIKALDSILVIEDLSFLTEQGIFLLLKLVEEAKFPIILLSTFDKISPIMLSRVRTKVKYLKESTTSEFMTPVQGLQKIEEELSEDSHHYDKVRYIGKYCPKLFALEKSLSGVRNKNKILSILD